MASKGSASEKGEQEEVWNMKLHYVVLGWAWDSDYWRHQGRHLRWRGWTQWGHTYAKYQHIFVLFRWISVRQRMLQKKDWFAIYLRWVFLRFLVGFQLCRDGGVEGMKRLGKSKNINQKKLKKWINSRDDQVNKKNQQQIITILSVWYTNALCCSKLWHRDDGRSDWTQSKVSISFINQSLKY